MRSKKMAKIIFANDLCETTADEITRKFLLQFHSNQFFSATIPMFKSSICVTSTKLKCTSTLHTLYL